MRTYISILSLLLAFSVFAACISHPVETEVGVCPDASVMDAGWDFVPCPDDVDSDCEQFDGIQGSGVVCTSGLTAFGGAGPFPGCLLWQWGDSPEEWCCPPTPQSAYVWGPDAGSYDGGPFGLAPCSEVQAECVDTNASAECVAWFADGKDSVARCITGSIPGESMSMPDAYHCIPDPSWGICGAYSPSLLCCTN
jgi:hypothetical protein